MAHGFWSQLFDLLFLLFKTAGIGLAIIFALRLLLLSSRGLLPTPRDPRRTGEFGEKRVAETLRCGLPDDCWLLNDIYLPLPDGTTTQIDHIVVSRFGVFVIETKAYSGWIFADERSAQWTQAFYRKKSRFQNPLRQNYLHIRTLAECLGINDALFHSIVVFAGRCEFRTAMPAGVVYLPDLIDYIRSFDVPVLAPAHVEGIVDVIAGIHDGLDAERIANHVENLKKRHAHQER